MIINNQHLRHGGRYVRRFRSIKHVIQEVREDNQGLGWLVKV